MGLSVQPETPNLAAQPRGYLIAQLAAYRSGKRVNEQMNVVARALTDEDIREIAEWFSALAVEARQPPK
jgi:cytochrome c553